MLVDQRETPQIVKAFELVGMHASCRETGPVIGRAGIGMLQVALQQAKFKALPVAATLRLQRRLPVGRIVVRPIFYVGLHRALFAMTVVDMDGLGESSAYQAVRIVPSNLARVKAFTSGERWISMNRGEK